MSVVDVVNSGLSNVDAVEEFDGEDDVLGVSFFHAVEPFGFSESAGGGVADDEVVGDFLSVDPIEAVFEVLFSVYGDELDSLGLVADGHVGLWHFGFFGDRVGLLDA